MTKRPDLAERSVPGIGLAVVAAVGFSISLVLARFSYDFGTNALTVLFVRFVAMAALSYAWCYLKGHALLADRGILPSCYLVGSFYFVGIGAYLSAVAYIPVSLAVLLFYTFPIMTTLLAAGLTRKRPSTEELGTLLLAFAGVFLALGVTLAELRPLGVGLALLAAVGVSVNLLVSERVLKRTSLAVFTFHMSVGAVIWVAVVTAATGSFALPESGTAGQLAFGIMLVAFLTAFMALYTSVRLIGSVPLAMILNLEPVATIVLALALLGESMVLQQVFGAALVIVAIVVAQSLRWRRHQRARGGAGQA